VAHVLRVGLQRDVTDAGRAAALDLVLQTGPGTVAEEGVLALTQLEELLQQPQCLTHRTRARVRPEVTPSPVAGSPVQRQARERLADGNVDVRVALVVPENDVVAGPVSLDEVAFQQEGFALRGRHGNLHRGDLGHHCPSLDR